MGSRKTYFLTSKDIIGEKGRREVALKTTYLSPLTPIHLPPPLCHLLFLPCSLSGPPFPSSRCFFISSHPVNVYSRSLSHHLVSLALAAARALFKPAVDSCLPVSLMRCFLALRVSVFLHIRYKVTSWKSDYISIFRLFIYILSVVVPNVFAFATSYPN